MKKILLTHLTPLIIFLGSLLITPINAEDIKCPREIPLPPKAYCLGKPASGGALCTGDIPQADRGKFLEQYGGAELKCETERFQNEVLDRAHHDNGSNPEFIAKEGVKQLRIHHQCLKDICRNVFLECLRYPGAANQDVEQQLDWCWKKSNRLLDLQKTKFRSIASANQERKERSLLDEKFAAIRERFRKHIHERMSQLLIHVTKFEKKVDRLIYNPH